MFNPLKAELDKMKIILATSSKQRHEILRRAGVSFDVQTPDFEENLDRTKYSFQEYVQETAFGKVKAVEAILAQKGENPDIIIGLDTMVSCGDKFYGKPKDSKDAIDTIRYLTNSNIPNIVLTGVCIKYKDNYEKFVESTKVYMRKLTEEEILGYVETGEPMGHAGSYAIQNIAASFVERIDGDYNNVIGLPLCAITLKLRELVKKYEQN